MSQFDCPRDSANQESAEHPNPQSPAPAAGITLPQEPNRVWRVRETRHSHRFEPLGFAPSAARPAKPILPQEDLQDSKPLNKVQKGESDIGIRLNRTEGNLFKHHTVEDYKRLLLTDPNQVARNLAEKLLTYATGAESQFADGEVIEQVVAHVKTKNYGFRTLVHDIVQSRMFRSE